MQEAEKDLDLEELERAIEESKRGKATGEDDIKNEMIKHLGTKGKEMLLCIMKKYWRGEATISQIWRTSIIRPFLKECKNPAATESCRLISLTSCVGKLMEKIIADRLMYHLEKRNLLNGNQAGFRSNRSTIDQVLKLSQSATDKMQNREKDSATLCCFIDYKKAFDKVWREGLLFKMMKMDIPSRYIKYIRQLLSGRKTKVQINGVNSREFYLNEGLPQG